MARRFGRNQRRRAREAVSALEEALEASKSNARTQMRHYNEELGKKDREIRSNERIFEAIIRVLGPNSAFIPPVFSPNFLVSEGAKAVLMGEKPTTAALLPPKKDKKPSAEALRASVLQVLSTESCVDKAKKCIHLRANMGNIGSSVYLIAEEALALLPEWQLNEMISNEIAPSLAKAITQLSIKVKQ